MRSVCRNEYRPIEGIATKTNEILSNTYKAVEMSIARLRALTQKKAHITESCFGFVEMSIARLRALTHFVYLVYSDMFQVEMSIARLRALTHSYVRCPG